MALYLLDASAWIEYFEGTERGRKVKTILINKKNRIIVPDAAVGEVFAYALREEKNFPLMLQIIKARAKIVDIYLNIWLEGAKRRHELRPSRKQFGYIDALLLSVQNLTGATIVTKDSHFKGLKRVVMI